MISFVFFEKCSENIDTRFCLLAGANIRTKRSESEVDSNLDSNGRCVAARNWKDDCNECFCVANGVPACTLRGCIHGPIPIEIVTVPGNYFLSHKSCPVTGHHF